MFSLSLSLSLSFSVTSLLASACIIYPSRRQPRMKQPRLLKCRSGLRGRLRATQRAQGSCSAYGLQRVCKSSVRWFINKHKFHPSSAPRNCRAGLRQTQLLQASAGCKHVSMTERGMTCAAECRRRSWHSSELLARIVLVRGVSNHVCRLPKTVQAAVGAD